jgi:hypothetical protein
MMLYGLPPITLRIGYRLSDPPIITDGATILVFHAGAQIQTHAAPMGNGGALQGIMTVPPLPQGSKLLGNFKLSQFNGTARQWKAWNKSFTRYLSIHQLDYVIEEGFLDLLHHSENAFAANKL